MARREAARKSTSFGLSAEFRVALARFARRTEDVCVRHGLTTDQYTLLLMIKSSPGHRSTVTEMAAQLHRMPNGIAERVRRAEEAGLVRREGSLADRRVSHLMLTDEGDTRLRAAFQELRKDDELLDSFTEAVAAFEREQDVT